MGRPQAPFERDGTPVREFAFWLRDLRNRSGLTYEQLAKTTHYATSTVQAATSGERLPTLKVVVAFVTACDGDVEAWRKYWTQLRRLLDPDAPDGVAASIAPPWVTEIKGVGPGPTTAEMMAGSEVAAGRGVNTVDDADDWYVESFRALLRMDIKPIEAIEQRVIVATRDGVTELSTSISIPRHEADTGADHRLYAELMHGGLMTRREQPYESVFRNVIELAEPLNSGDRHEYAMVLRVPPDQLMVPRYVHMPYRRSDYFELKIRFSPENRPKAIWRVSGVPYSVVYERGPANDTLVVDRFGEVKVSFRDLRTGLGYGICWLTADGPDPA
jgi:transcriptional regulator with XRE-family HTH domain